MPHFKHLPRGPLIAGRALLVGLILLAAPDPTPADAGIYQQFDCRRPDGTWAPTDGWSPVSEQTSCPRESQPWELRAERAPLTWAESDAALSLYAFSIRRSVSPGTAVCHPVIGCQSLAAGVVTADGLDGGEISVVSDADAATIEAATITLLDMSDPRVGQVGGSLSSGLPLWGIADLRYQASDDGSGIYRHRLIVDGVTVISEVPDTNDGRCRDAVPGSGSDYEFDYTVPCPPTVTGRIAFDTNALTPGTHLVEAVIEDAAGNQRSLYRGQIAVISDPARRRFDVDGVSGLTNPLGDRPGSVPNGSRASRFAGVTALFERPGGRRARTAVTTFPQMPTVAGRLVNAEGPIGGAAVSLLQRVSGTARWEAVATGTTSAEGIVRFHVPSGPSRALRIAYFADSEATTFTSSQALALRVRPSVSLRASRTAGRRVRLSGKVRGGIMPAGGLTVELEACVTGTSWRTFRTVRTGRDGRFATSHRFTAVRSRFRAIVQRHAGYPFEPATAQARLKGSADRCARRGEFR